MIFHKLELEEVMQDIRVSTNQIKLQVRDYEHEGEAIIFLHFSGANLMMWQRVVPWFQNQFRVVLVDLRGHGKSATPEIGYHMDEMARDVIGVMDHLQIEKAHIVGSSLGAETGLSLAANYPERIISLILDGAMNSEFGPYGLWEGTEEAFEEHVAAQLEKIRNAPATIFPSLETLMENRKDLYEKFNWWNESVADMEQYGVQELEDGHFIRGWGKHANASYTQNYFHYRFEEFYPKIKCPILMLMNKDLEDGREKEVLFGFRDLAENAEIGEVDGWEHPFLWMLDPDEACEAIQRFLDTKKKIHIDNPK